MHRTVTPGDEVTVDYMAGGSLHTVTGTVFADVSDQHLQVEVDGQMYRLPKRIILRVSS